MEDIQEEIIKRLEENALTSSNNKMYRVVDPRGRVYSLQLGWQRISGKLYGHLFDENEISIVIDVLNKHGYRNVRSEKDKTGTLFMLAANSPFGDSKKMGQLISVTVIFFILLYITLQFGILESLFEIIEQQTTTNKG